MVARRLRLFLGLEIAVYLGLGAWLVNARGWSGCEAIALAVACAIVLRLALGLTVYAFAWRWRSATPQAFRLGPLAMTGHVLGELAALAAVFTVLQPFDRLWMGARRPPVGSGARLPVLLVHGYVCNRAVWRPLAETLRRRGECVTAPSFEPVYGSIDLWVPQLAARIDELLAATGREQVVLVAHSLGGLAVRACLRTHGGGKVARVITLGAPHHGSMHAHLGAGQNAREMEPGSAWLAALAAAETGGVAAPLLSIYSHHDDFVTPQSGAAHPHARNVPLAGVGHVAMLFSGRVRGLVLREIDAANAIS
jgi:triacylglycerol esterase/lipase EstA (alpha/beta hydrolase family)